MGDGNTPIVDIIKAAGEDLAARGGKALKKATAQVQRLDAWRTAVVEHVAMLWECSHSDARWRELSVLGLGVRKGVHGRARLLPSAYLTALSVATGNACGTGVRSAGQLLSGMAAADADTVVRLGAEERKARKRGLEPDARAALSLSTRHACPRTVDRCVRTYNCVNYYSAARHKVRKVTTTTASTGEGIRTRRTTKARTPRGDHDDDDDTPREGLGRCESLLRPPPPALPPQAARPGRGALEPRSRRDARGGRQGHGCDVGVPRKGCALLGADDGSLRGECRRGPSPPVPLSAHLP